MGRAVDFIGLGAQRSGTSWIYACLFEHPQICMPVKEIHFFSRERNWSKGKGWYEGHFDACPAAARAGEYSTSYLTDRDAPARIHENYPNAKLLVSLRNPVDRAYSSYVNDIMAGKVDRRQSFAEAVRANADYIDHGRYAMHLGRYRQYFSPDQLLIMIYEDALRDPLAFIRRILQFLEVDLSFEPSMVRARVNVGHVPRFFVVERLLRRTSEILRRSGWTSGWWRLKKAGVGSGIRSLNTAAAASRKDLLDDSARRAVYARLADDICAVEKMVDRELREWHS